MGPWSRREPPPPPTRAACSGAGCAGREAARAGGGGWAAARRPPRYGGGGADSAQGCGRPGCPWGSREPPALVRASCRLDTPRHTLPHARPQEVQSGAGRRYHMPYARSQEVQSGTGWRYSMPHARPQEVQSGAGRRYSMSHARSQEVQSGAGGRYHMPHATPPCPTTYIVPHPGLGHQSPLRPPSSMSRCSCAEPQPAVWPQSAPTPGSPGGLPAPSHRQGGW